MIDAAVDAMYATDDDEPVPRGHVPERRQGDPVLQGLLVGRHDREHRAAGEEARRSSARSPAASAGIRTEDLLDSIKQEFREHEDLPNTTNPDDWAKISGKKGERIVYVRTLVNEGDDDHGRPADRAGHHRPVPVAARRSDARRRGASVGSTPWPCRRSCGIETEYGVALRGARRPEPVLASSLLINGYVEQRRVGWDFEDESPGRDARGFARDGAQPPEIETHLVNAVLTNGARYYVDHAHPEYSTPECADALECVVCDKAGERILARSMDAARRLLPRRARRSSSTRTTPTARATRYGCHENYLVDRDGAVRGARAQPACRGSSPARCSPARARSAAENGADAVDYQISQRADFFEEEVGLETTLKRPIVNTRDEPHADPQKYRRLHVIVGDANLCEVATFLKVGTTAIVLAMIEDGFIDKDLSIIGAGRRDAHGVARPHAAARTVELADGGALHRGRAAVGVPAPGAQVRRRDRPRVRAAATTSAAMVLDRWEAVLTALERDPDGARRPARLGHQATRCSSAYVDRDGLALGRPEAGAARPPVPRRAARPLALRAPGAGGQGRAAGRRGRRDRRDDRAARDDPGLLPGHVPARAGPTRSWPRTGTAWSSTSAPTRCGGSR